jgi:hypothetical protein
MKPLLGSLSGSTLEESRVFSDGDHERFAHYAPAEEVTRAIVEGVPVVALCGKVWVPHRDPQKYAVCPTCKELYEALGD